MPEPFSQALAAPELPHAAHCDLSCSRCGATTTCLVRGIAVTADLAVLGDLRCGQCSGADLALMAPELEALLAAMRGLLDSKKPLPQAEDAFLRGGPFRWLGKLYEDPRALRAALEVESAMNPDDPSAQLRAAAGMVQVRDMRRALEFARTAHEQAPSAPEPALFVAEVGYAIGNGEQAAQFAREALARKDGPLIVMSDRQRLIEGILRLIQAGDALRAATAPRAADGDPCPCGSGATYARCHGAAS